MMFDKAQWRCKAVWFAMSKQYISIKVVERKDKPTDYVSVTNMGVKEALLGTLMVAEGYHQLDEGFDGALKEAKDILDAQ